MNCQISIFLTFLIFWLFPSFQLTLIIIAFLNKKSKFQIFSILLLPAILCYVSAVVSQSIPFWYSEYSYNSNYSHYSNGPSFLINCHFSIFPTFLIFCLFPLFHRGLCRQSFCKSLNIPIIPTNLIITIVHIPKFLKFCLFPLF